MPKIALEWQRFAEFSAAGLYQLLRFRQAIFVVEQRCAYPDLDERDQEAHHLLLRLGGHLAGYLRLIPSADGAGIAIGRVAVGQEHRSRGLARRMMEEALARCRRDYPGRAITLAAQTYLAPFYEGLGFRATSEPFDDYGVEHVEMALSPLKG